MYFKVLLKMGLRVLVIEFVLWVDFLEWEGSIFICI